MKCDQIITTSLKKEAVVVSIGITLNPSARNKFFLIVPEIARLTEEAKNMAGLTRQKKKKPKEHHNLSTAVLIHKERSVKKLTAAIERFTNPFTWLLESMSFQSFHDLCLQMMEQSFIAQ